MNEATLFVITYPKYKMYAEAYVCSGADYDDEKPERCPLCNRRVSGSLWLHPWRIYLTRGRLPDILYGYGMPNRFIVSKQLLLAMKDAQLTGIEAAEPIDCIYLDKKLRATLENTQYYSLTLARSRMAINHSQSQIIYGSHTHFCSLCKPVPRTYDHICSLTLNMEQYEGFDLFHIYELGTTVFASQKFVDFIKDHHFANLYCEPVEEYDSRTKLILSESEIKRRLTESEI